MTTTIHSSSFLFNLFVRFFSSRKSLSLWQLTHGNIFIQMIYSLDNELLDCEYLDGLEFVEQFNEKFNEEISEAMKHRSSIDLNVLSQSYQLPKFRHQTKINKIDMTMDSIDELNGMKNLTYQIITDITKIPDDLKQMTNFNSLKTQCDANHQKVMRIINDLHSNSDDSRRNATDHLNR